MEDDDLMPTTKLPRISKLPEKAPPTPMPIIPDLPPIPVEAEEAPWAPSSWRPPSSQASAPTYAPSAVPAQAWSLPPPVPATPTPRPAIIEPPAWVQSIQAAPSAPNETATEEEEPMTTQWEYCRVQLDSGSYSQKQTVGRYPYFVRVSIDYYGADVPPTANFGEDTDQTDRPNKVWGKIVGLLGLANWEMVNVYLGTAKDLSLINVMAYFKRPVQQGRSVDEPKIKL